MLGQVLPIQSAEWEALWDGKALISDGQIEASLSFDVIRSIRGTCPKNLATLIRRVRAARSPLNHC